jgi:hypothetical protein
MHVDSPVRGQGGVVVGVVSGRGGQGGAGPCGHLGPGGPLLHRVGITLWKK